MAKDILIDQLFATTDPNTFSVRNQFTDNPKTVEGIRKLAQCVQKILLTTPGTDSYNILSGGGIRNLLKANATPSDLSNITSLAVTAIGTTRREIIQYQADGDLPLDEQLKDLYLVSTDFDEESLTAKIRVAVVSKTEEVIEIDLP